MLYVNNSCRNFEHVCPTPSSLPRMVTDRVMPGIPNMQVGGDVQLPIFSGGPSKLSISSWATSPLSTKLLKNGVWLKAFLSTGLNSEQTCIILHIHIRMYVWMLLVTRVIQIKKFWLILNLTVLYNEGRSPNSQIYFNSPIKFSSHNVIIHSRWILLQWEDVCNVYEHGTLLRLCSSNDIDGNVISQT